MRKLRLIIFFIALIGMGTCTTYQLTVNNKNFAYKYSPVSSNLHPQFYLWALSDSQNQINIRLPRKEVVFTTKNNDSKPKTFISVNYKIKQSATSSMVLDSGTWLVEIPDTNHSMVDFPILVKSPSFKHLFISLNVKDISSGKNVEEFLTMENKSSDSKQNFLVEDEHGSILYDLIATTGKKIRIKHRNPSIERYFIKKFPMNLNPALPPFSMTPYRFSNTIEDTTFIYKRNELFTLSESGIYFIQTDTSQTEGIAIICMKKGFPTFSTPSEMLISLRYLLNNREYKLYMGYQNKKLAIDEFWLKAGTNIARGKDLIKVYYNRAVLANIYFSSFKEGWQTDRGMIYIIFGKPNYVYKTMTTEKWIYGNLQSSSSLSFVFEMQPNPFSDNNFVLNRLEYYKAIWYQAVSTWRDGRIYSIGS